MESSEETVHQEASKISVGIEKTALLALTSWGQLFRSSIKDSDHMEMTIVIAAESMLL
jgi:hypothetical protein